METKEAIYENGQVTFLDKKLPRKRFKVLVTFVEEVAVQSNETMNGKKFVKKWRGILKDTGIMDVEAEKLRYLEEKYK